MGNSQNKNAKTTSSSTSPPSSNDLIQWSNSSIQSYKSRAEAPHSSAKVDTTLIRSPNTLVHFPSTSTTLPKTSTNLPKTSTNLPKTSTNLPKTSTNLPKTSTNLSSISTNLPKTSTNLPKTSTTLSKTSTNLPKTSTNLPKTSTNLPKTSTNLPKSSVHLTSTSVQWPVSILSSINPPRPLISEEEFFQKWSDWKIDFLTFKKISNEEKPDDGKWGNKLLNTMGPVGQQIYNTFKFDYFNDRNNLDVLLNKFDEYCTFKSEHKPPDVDVYEYINQLQLRANQADIKNAEGFIKKQILKEIDERVFTHVAKGLLPSFKFSSDFNNLTLKEIAYIWKMYDGDFGENCNKCGYNHNDNRCPALGKQCSKCNEFNHFARRCPTFFSTDCNYCGDSHILSRNKCPAYKEICSKCKRQDHFSWKCGIFYCEFCGYTHNTIRSLCPAYNTTCIRCQKKGHFSPQCKTGPHSNNR